MYRDVIFEPPAETLGEGSRFVCRGPVVAKYKSGLPIENDNVGLSLMTILASGLTSTTLKWTPQERQADRLYEFASIVYATRDMTWLRAIIAISPNVRLIGYFNQMFGKCLEAPTSRIVDETISECGPVQAKRMGSPITNVPIRNISNSIVSKRFKKTI